MKETKFKQTEVGKIPWDWEVKEFKNVATLINGRAYSQFELLDRGKYRVLRVGNFGTNDSWYYSNLELPEKMYCENGDLLYCWSCTYGAYIWNQEKTIYHYHIWKIANLKAEKKYLQYILNNDVAQQMNSSNGSTMAHITKGFLENRLFAFPPTKEEQQRIAKALSDVDSLISNLEKLIAKKKNIKQGAMQQLLTGRKRLPGFAPSCHPERSTKCAVEGSSHFKMTELGPIPSDWEMKPFGDLFEILPNNTLSRAELNAENGCYKNVHYGDVLVKFQEWIDCSKTALPFINSNAKFNHLTLQDGDVIIADTAEDETVGKSTEVVNTRNVKIVSGLHTIPIRPKVKFASKWLGYYINSVCWHNQILPYITGTKVSAISKAAVAQTKFFYPAKIEEQTAIANVLSDMDSEIQTLETKLAKYRKLKTGMMQQLLTGKIRLV